MNLFNIQNKWTHTPPREPSKWPGASIREVGQTWWSPQGRIAEGKGKRLMAARDRSHRRGSARHRVLAELILQAARLSGHTEAWQTRISRATLQQGYKECLSTLIHGLHSAMSTQNFQKAWFSRQTRAQKPSHQLKTAANTSRSISAARTSLCANQMSPFHPRIWSRIQAAKPRSWCKSHWRGEREGRTLREQAERGWCGRVSITQAMLTTMPMGRLNHFKLRCSASSNIKAAQRHNGKRIKGSSNSECQQNLMFLVFRESLAQPSSQQVLRKSQLVHTMANRGRRTQPARDSLMRSWLAALSYSNQSQAISIWCRASSQIQATTTKVTTKHWRWPSRRHKILTIRSSRRVTIPQSIRTCSAQQANWTTRARSATSCSWSLPTSRTKSATV